MSKRDEVSDGASIREVCVGGVPSSGAAVGGGWLYTSVLSGRIA